MKTQSILKFLRVSVAALICLCFAINLNGQDGSKSQPAADSTVSQFHRSRPVELESPQAPTLAAMRLDAEILSHTRDGLPDMRLLDDALHQVPFLVNPLRQPATDLIRRTWTAEIKQLKPLPEGSLEILVILPDSDPPPAGLQLITPLKNFELRVRIHAGANADAPVLVEDALLYDYSQFMNAHHTEVPLPGNTSRTLLIVVDQAIQIAESRLQELTRTISKGEETQREETVFAERRPLRIDRLLFWTEVPNPAGRKPVLESWPAKSLKIEEDPVTHDTLVYFSADGRPLTQITLQTSSRNFSRSVTAECQSPNLPQRWSVCGNAECRLLDISGVRDSQLTLQFPGQQRWPLRLRIKNGDSPPLAVTGLELAGPVSEILWIAEPGRNYRLLYDDEHVVAPQHDLLALKTALDSNSETIKAVAGAPEVRNVTLPATVRANDLLNNPILLISLALLFIAFMAWGLYRAFERVRTLPQDP